MVGAAKDKHQAPTNGLKLYVNVVFKSGRAIKEETIATHVSTMIGFTTKHADCRMI